jgi:hypothetical protein
MANQQSNQPKNQQQQGTAKAPGQQQVSQMTRTNPQTGETETQDITNEQWRMDGQRLRAEGWSRPEDTTEGPEGGTA